MEFISISFTGHIRILENSKDTDEVYTDDKCRKFVASNVGSSENYRAGPCCHAEDGCSDKRGQHKRRTLGCYSKVVLEVKPHWRFANVVVWGKAPPYIPQPVFFFVPSQLVSSALEPPPPELIPPLPPAAVCDLSTLLSMATPLRVKA